jgi:hypothetical protein
MYRVLPLLNSGHTSPHPHLHYSISIYFDALSFDLFKILSSFCMKMGRGNGRNKMKILDVC